MQAVDMGCGIWDMGCGIWDADHGMQVWGSKLQPGMSMRLTPELITQINPSPAKVVPARSSPGRAGARDRGGWGVSCSRRVSAAGCWCHRPCHHGCAGEPRPPAQSSGAGTQPQGCSSRILARGDCGHHLTFPPPSSRNSCSTWYFYSAASCDIKSNGREIKNTQNIYQNSSF